MLCVEEKPHTKAVWDVKAHGIMTVFTEPQTTFNNEPHQSDRAHTCRAFTAKHVNTFAALVTPRSKWNYCFLGVQGNKAKIDEIRK